jgi:hypothetical protein
LPVPFTPLSYLPKPIGLDLVFEPFERKTLAFDIIGNTVIRRRGENHVYGGRSNAGPKVLGIAANDFDGAHGCILAEPC